MCRIETQVHCSALDDESGCVGLDMVSCVSTSGNIDKKSCVKNSAEILFINTCTFLHKTLKSQCSSFIVFFPLIIAGRNFSY